jgi:AraC-like DNA-binding protein
VEWEGDLEKAATTQDLVLAFRNHLDRLTHFLMKPRSLESAIGMEKAKRYLDGSFHQAPRVPELARMAGVAPEVFSRKFRLLTGVAYNRYTRDLRIGKARQLLASGLLPVSRIAGLCGFKSIPTFIHTFKRATGFNPSRYRQNHR